MIRLKSLFTIVSVLAVASFSAVRAENIIITVNVNQAAAGYYKVIELMEELQSVDAQAREQVASMEEGGKGLVQEFEELVEVAKSDILTEDARKDAEKDAIEVRNKIQEKQNEIREYVGNTERSMAARRQTQMSVFVKEIADVISEIREEKGATLVLDVSGGSNNGLPVVLFADESNDITAEVVERINANKPATAAPAAE